MKKISVLGLFAAIAMNLSLIGGVWAVPIMKTEKADLIPAGSPKVDPRSPHPAVAVMQAMKLGINFIPGGGSPATPVPPVVVAIEGIPVGDIIDDEPPEHVTVEGFPVNGIIEDLPLGRD